jgi:predicted Zn-dependent protease
MAGVGGCATSRSVRSAGRSGAAVNQPAAAATEPADSKAYLPLEQIPVTGSLSITPSTQPGGRAPLAALELYGRARDAMVQGERFTAITLLEKAVGLDPCSYDAWFDLGKAYLSVANMEDKGIAALEHAAALEPDHLDLQIQLGRQYLTRGENEKSIQHLRMALLSSGYADDDAQAAVADFFLARALQQGGYDRAALDRYNLLLQRLHDQASELRQNPELALLLQRPEVLFLEIGQLYEKHGAYAQALAAYEPLAERSPDNFELQARVARMQASLGRRDDALARCADLIVRTRATPESLSLLAEVCQRLNLSDGVVAALSRLHQNRPDDRAVLLALCDTLLAENRPADAQKLLADSWQRTPGDVQLTRRLFVLQVEAGEKQAAGRLLILSLASNPDGLQNFAPLWDQLLRPSRLDRLPVSQAEALTVPAGAQASKLVWLAHTADLYHRDTLVRERLENAVKVRPPFAPAFRELANDQWNRDEWSEGQKIAECDRRWRRRAGPVGWRTRCAGSRCCGRSSWRRRTRRWGGRLGWRGRPLRRSCWRSLPRLRATAGGMHATRGCCRKSFRIIRCLGRRTCCCFVTTRTRRWGICSRR